MSTVVIYFQIYYATVGMLSFKDQTLYVNLNSIVEKDN